MRARLFLALGIAGICLASAAPAAAQGKPSGAKEAQPSKGARKVPKDPANKAGISPYMEQIGKGDATYVAQDLQGAVAAYQEAIKLDGQKALGFYRLGETQRDLGKLDEADAAFQSALSRKGSEDTQAKVLFCVADLRERQGNMQGAIEAWKAYASFLEQNPKAIGYAATAAERIKQAERRVQLVKDYGEVKERIKKREAERLKEAEDNARKDTKNR